MKKIWYCLLTVVLILSLALAACAAPAGQQEEEEEEDSTYKLTHSAADVEYILGWDFIVSQCPDIGTLDKIEGFVHRGDSMQLTTGETHSLDEDSPAAWSSTRFVRTESEGKFRSFAVGIGFHETTETAEDLLLLDELDELVRIIGFSVQTEGDFATAVHETETPIKTIRLLLAGKHVSVLIQEFASPEESFFFDKDALIELGSIAKSNISSLEITPLPS